MEKEMIRVILADDHAVVRSGIKQFLEQAGDILIVAEAEDGLKAQEIILEHQPDVAVLDIQMPGLTGIELTKWLKEIKPEIGILVLTAYDDEPYVKAVLKAGANGYILKTSTPTEIIQAVREVNDGKSVLDSVIAKNLITKITADENIYEPITERELEVLRFVAKGFTNKAIGVQLGISDRTVQGHLAHIFTKLQASSRTEAVMRAISLNWLPASISEYK